MTVPRIVLDGETGSIVSAALALATEKPWKDVALRDIAGRAGLTLSQMRAHAGSKAEVLALFGRAVDEAVLAARRERVAADGRRDELFEVVMARFDALEPYRTALKSISTDAGPDPALIRAAFASQSWMLEAAGIDTSGLEGRMRVAGLVAIYASVFRTWLDDDDPGLARTMAALDRRLRRGERTLQSLDGLGRSVRSAGDWLSRVVNGARRDPAPAHETQEAAAPTGQDGARSA
ncbi:MAG: TetR/AcrR family transcriptional regulator [Hyphomicrobiaceae bacterium]